MPPKISSDTQALNPNYFLQAGAESTSPIKAPVQIENDDAGSDFSKKSRSLSVKDLHSIENEEMPPSIFKEIDPFVSKDIAAADAVREDRDHLPLLQKLLVQLEQIIPLLLKLEHGQRLTQQEEMDLMSSFSESKIGNIYFGGVISFGGNMLGAAVSVLAGREAGQLISGIVQGISSLAEGSKERAGAGYQKEQMNYQTVGDVRKDTERLRSLIMDAVQRADQLSYLRG
jgi:hypothetical protein